MHVGLVLSGGGARCFAQIGALRAFEERGVRVSAVAANSAAGFIGALLASGHSAATIYEIFSEADYGSLLDVKGGGGLLGHAGIEALLAEHLPETFEDLAIPLVVPAVDIRTAERVVLSSGPLLTALCASNAFPGLFRPVELAGRRLMDGGILSNVPLDLIRPLTSAPILVVDVRPPPTKPLELPPEDAGTWERLRASFDGGVPLVIQVLEQAYTITQSRLIELTYAMHPPDFTVTPELGADFDVQDFSRFEEAYDLGLQATRRALPGIMRRGGP